MANNGAGGTRGVYLIKDGAVITVDPQQGTLPQADVLVRDGAIEEIGTGLAAADAEIIDASDMIMMPGLIDTHYHMWSALGRNFLSDGGFDYFPAKWATAEHYGPEDFHNSVMLGLAELADGGVTCVHNWSHNNRSPGHVDGELDAHRKSRLRARYSLGHVDRMPPDTVNTFDDLDRVRSEWFADASRLDGMVHLGVNLRGTVQSEARVFHHEMEDMLRRGLAVSIHASQTRPNTDDAADYERRGYLGTKFLFCHYLGATDSDREAMARTGTPLSYATHSEFRLGDHGDPRESLIKARAAGVSVSLSSDASSIAPPNMFENMRFTWNMCIPWKETDTSDMAPLGFVEAIEMATINGAIALGLGEVTGSLTPGKRADLILIRTTDLNIAPLANIEATVVQSATPANVDTVMVDGRLIKRHGRLTEYDVPAIVARAKESALRVRAASGGVLTPSADGCGNPIHRAAGI
jgi:cytosine/adenosine deaminase-related metal-dependent hydrolase